MVTTAQTIEIDGPEAALDDLRDVLSEYGIQVDKQKVTQFSSGAADGFTLVICLYAAARVAEAITAYLKRNHVRIEAAEFDDAGGLRKFEFEGRLDVSDVEKLKQATAGIFLQGKDSDKDA